MTLRDTKHVHVILFLLNKFMFDHIFLSSAPKESEGYAIPKRCHVLSTQH